MDLAGRESSKERELLSLLFGLNQQMSGGASLEDILEEIAIAACRLSHGTAASVMLFDNRRERLLCRASAGLPKHEAESITFHLGEGIAGWVAAHGQPLRVDDARDDPRFLPVRDQRTELRSLCCVPMFARSGVIGVITASAPEVGQFDDEDQELLCYLAAAIASDVENARLYRLAVTDPLTGAFNRQMLSERLPGEVERHRRYGQPLSLMIVDIDHFKRVNDTWGHQAGDAVLAELSRRLLAMIRDVDSLVRYGGEEFLIILPSTPLDGALLMAERLRYQVSSRPIRFPDKEREQQLRLTVSVGITELDAADSAAKLIARADGALYAAKAAGRNCVQAMAEND